jgi:restriction endonuclease S subunit
MSLPFAPEQLSERRLAIEGGLLGVLQAGDVGLDGRIDLSKLLRVDVAPTQSEPQKLSDGDVVMQCRGQTYRTAVVPPHIGTLVATASLLVLQPKPAVRPAYLAHFLNDPVTQAELRKLATGATIANLKRSAVEQLEVLVPSLQDQDKIIALAESLRHQSRLEGRIADLRRIELRALIEERAERNRKRSNASGP